MMTTSSRSHIDIGFSMGIYYPKPIVNQPSGETRTEDYEERKTKDDATGEPNLISVCTLGFGR